MSKTRADKEKEEYIIGRGEEAGGSMGQRGGAQETMIAHPDCTADKCGD